MTSRPAAAFASFEEKWLQANPEQATVAVFLNPERRRRANAFGSLVHELEQSAFGRMEPQVAAVKLQWWRQELGDAAAGRARHPITRELFDDDRVHAIDRPLWPALADGALAQIDRGGASSLGELATDLGDFYRPVAVLDLVLAEGDIAQANASARLWSGSLLVRGAARPQYSRALPMDLLARHGLARDDLERAGPQRSALLRDFLGLVGADIEGALAEATRGTLGRRVRARLDLDLVRRAARAAEPAALLAGHTRIPRWRALWLSWSEARRLARR